MPRKTIKQKLHEIIFGTDTPAGKGFDITLLFAIIFSVIVVVLESMPAMRAAYGPKLFAAEWFFTILFTIEYFLRLYTVPQKSKYMTSFFGIVDLLAVLPTYISYFIPGVQFLIVIRALRLLRVFRILKLARYIDEAQILINVINNSKRKITIFLSLVLTIALILGTMLYIFENAANPGFESIPQSVYWAVVTITTVGYGDVVPFTAIGKMLASIIMLLGYSIIAVPTGIVTAEFIESTKDRKYSVTCDTCGQFSHAKDARYCRYCGTKIRKK